MMVKIDSNLKAAGAGWTDDTEQLVDRGCSISPVLPGRCETVLLILCNYNLWFSILITLHV